MSYRKLQKQIISLFNYLSTNSRQDLALICKLWQVQLYLIGRRNHEVHRWSLWASPLAKFAFFTLLSFDIEYWIFEFPHLRTNFALLYQLKLKITQILFSIIRNGETSIRTITLTFPYKLMTRPQNT